MYKFKNSRAAFCCFLAVYYEPVSDDNLTVLAVEMTPEVTEKEGAMAAAMQDLRTTMKLNAMVRGKTIHDIKFITYDLYRYHEKRAGGRK